MKIELPRLHAYRIYGHHVYNEPSSPGMGTGFYFTLYGVTCIIVMNIVTKFGVKEIGKAWHHVNLMTISTFVAYNIANSGYKLIEKQQNMWYLCFFRVFGWTVVVEIIVAPMREILRGIDSQHSDKEGMSAERLQAERSS